ncbi:UNVERIFIED_CONTAM: hypothetical protein FKN15_015531 [Acipenser sinensis]
MADFRVSTYHRIEQSKGKHTVYLTQRPFCFSLCVSPGACCMLTRWLTTHGWVGTAALAASVPQCTLSPWYFGASVHTVLGARGAHGTSVPLCTRYPVHSVYTVLGMHGALVARARSDQCSRFAPEQAQPTATTPALTREWRRSECPPKRVLSADRFFTHCKLTMQPPRATALEDNAAPGSLQASLQAPGQTTGVAGARPRLEDNKGTPQRQTGYYFK